MNTEQLQLWVRSKFEFVSPCESSPVTFEIAENPEVGIGFKVWRAASELCRYICNDIATSSSPLLYSGCPVLELGSGCGLVGLSCAHLGADVTLTDKDDVLPITLFNVKCNNLPCGTHGTVQVRELHWGTDIREPFPRGSFKLIVGSDLTYFEHLHEPLLLTLLQLVDCDTQVILAHARRRNEFERWRARFERYFNIDILCEESEHEASASPAQHGKAHPGRRITDECEESEPISIFCLRLSSSPPSDEDIEKLLLSSRDESTAALLAKLAMLESDIDTIEGVDT